MDAREVIRTVQLLAACEVAPEVFAQVMPRLHTCMAPFVDPCGGHALPPHATTSLPGLLSDVERQNVDAIADPCGQDRLGLQRCIGWADGDEAPVRQAWRAPVGKPWGQEDGVLVCDPAAFPTSGRESVGVARPWCGRLGPVDHGHVALSLGYVSRPGHPLVDRRLSLPKAGTHDQARLDHAGVPQACRGSRTRHPWALEMLASHGPALPQGGLAGDDERGRPSWCRRRLAAWGERHMVAVPSHTLRRALETEPPADRGRGRRPTRPWPSVRPWSPSLDDGA
jgi:hypothetical protein